MRNIVRKLLVPALALCALACFILTFVQSSLIPNSGEAETRHVILMVIFLYAGVLFLFAICCAQAYRNHPERERERQSRRELYRKLNISEPD